MSGTVPNNDFEGEILPPGGGAVFSYVAIGPNADCALSVPNRSWVMLNSTATGASMGRMDLVAHEDPVEIVFSRNGLRGYIVQNFPSAVREFDTLSWKILRKVNFGTDFSKAVSSPNSDHLYIAQKNEVLVVDVINFGLRKVVDVEGVVEGLAVSPDGLYLYVLAGALFLIVDVSNWTMTSISIQAGESGSACMSLDLDGKRAFVVGEYEGGTVQVIDIANQSVSSTPLRYGGGRDSALSPDGKHLYVLTVYGAILCIFNIEDDLPILVKDINLGANPLKVAITPNGSRAYISIGRAIKVFRLVGGVPVAD